jgi:ferritin
MLAWFTEEQVEEEASAGKIADELEMIGEDKSALLMLDRELGTRAYPPGSPFDPAAASAE